MSAICIPVFLGEFVGVGVMAWAASTGVAVTLALAAVINCLFHILNQAPTRSGQALMDEIEDLRTFLSTMEKGQRGGRTALKITPPLFERLLPYAMALNVETAWGEKFAAALASTARWGAIKYSPRWYFGPGWTPSPPRPS